MNKWALRVVMLVLGAALLVAPSQVAKLWPWPLTALTGRAAPTCAQPAGPDGRCLPAADRGLGRLDRISGNLFECRTQINDIALGDAGNPEHLRNMPRELIELLFDYLQGRLGSFALGDVLHRADQPAHAAGGVIQRGAARAVAAALWPGSQHR